MKVRQMSMKTKPTKLNDYGFDNDNIQVSDPNNFAATHNQWLKGSNKISGK